MRNDTRAAARARMLPAGAPEGRGFQAAPPVASFVRAAFWRTAFAAAASVRAALSGAAFTAAATVWAALAVISVAVTLVVVPPAPAWTRPGVPAAAPSVAAPVRETPPVAAPVPADPSSGPPAAASGAPGTAVRLSHAAPLQAAMEREDHVATFSIVGFDPETGEVGVAVASRFLAVGSVVPWAEAGAGAIATQAYANTTYGPLGLALLRDGLSAQAVLDSLVAMDEGRDERQVGIVDARGGSATYTGKGCIAWAGGRKGRNYACQGNILVDEKTVDAMEETFENTTGPLATRLLRALKAGEGAGGDSRGKQSAAMYVAKEGGGYQGLNDRFIDLRVDDHEEPITELQRLVSIQLAYQALYRAMTMREAGDLQGAICELECARDACPGVAYLHYDLACYYSLSGQKSKALEELEKAVSIEPEFKRMAVEDEDLHTIRGEAKFKVITQ